MNFVAAAGGEAPPNFLVPNATIFVVFVIFLLVLFFFYRFVVPPLTKAMAERDEMIRKQVEDRDNAQRIWNAVSVACESRRLSHGGISDEDRVAMEANAEILAVRWPAADGVDIAVELLRMLNEGKTARRRRSR